MTFNEVDSVVKEMRLPNGIIWPIPIVFDIDEVNGIKEGDAIGITYMGKPLGIMCVSEIYTYDKNYMAEKVYKTGDVKHPDVKRTLSYANKFIAGDIWLIREPKFNQPYADFWLTPL